MLILNEPGSGLLAQKLELHFSIKALDRLAALIQTGQVVNRCIQPDAYELNNSPLDNSFQIDPQSFNVSKGLWEQPNVPTTLSRMFGAITAVTAKDTGVGANSLFQAGVASDALLENINFFRTAHSQIGVNDGDPRPMYLNNIMLATKILNQTS